jgi:cystathionine beta-lyase/cystathionine gamma-synthase
MAEQPARRRFNAGSRAAEIAPHFFGLETPRTLRSTQTGVHAEYYLYARYGTPTNAALEAALVRCFGGSWAMTAASGMAAIDIAVSSAIRVCERDKPVIGVLEGLYVGSRRYFERVLAGCRRMQACALSSDPADPNILRAALDRVQPHIVFAESITNPLLFSLNLDVIREYRRKSGCLVIIDDTIRCSLDDCLLSSGVADMVVHSATKYVCARNDTIAGIVLGASERILEGAFEYRKFAGALLPDCSGLRLLQDISSLASRFAAQRANAQRVGQFIASHRAVKATWTNPEAALVTFKIDNESSTPFFEAGHRGLPIAASFGSAETTATPLDLLDSRFAGQPMVRLSCGTEDIAVILSKLAASFARLEGS